ncbi:MAG TPA: response regulator transcription factor [Bacteroidales bacterium]|jgi:DNA-binding response OmpR family regulator|nr:response regulator transcription factor [Bacteroidales bacterium]
MEQKAKILLVEDDPNLSDVLTDFLEMLGYRVVLAVDGSKGLAEFTKEKFDLLILDVMLPVMDGFSLAAEIRKTDANVPIIFLTARGQMEDRINGFRLGCDDYIAKPFSSEELSLRIEAILRRCRLESKPAVESYTLGQFVFDPANFELRRKDKRINLTPKEAALLRVLCEHKNMLLTREKALKEVWGDDDYFIGRSMDVFITKLRKYLKDDPDVAIVNVHGTGFRMEVKE